MHTLESSWSTANPDECEEDCGKDELIMFGCRESRWLRCEYCHNAKLEQRIAKEEADKQEAKCLAKEETEQDEAEGDPRGKVEIYEDEANGKEDTSKPSGIKHL